MKTPITSLKSLVSLSIALLITAVPAFGAKTVNLNAGSVNALAAAIAQAGNGGKVIVKTGVHTENNPVIVGIPVTIVGERSTGAIIQNGNAPDAFYPLNVVPILDIKNTTNVKVKDIEFRPTGTVANTAILIENSGGVEIRGNLINNFQFGVFIHKGPSAVVNGNTINPSNRWTLAPNDPNFLPEADGIVLNSGANVDINNNAISGGFFNIFVSDTNGAAGGNTVNGGEYGFFIARNPQSQPFYQINGVNVFSDASANGWLIHGNTATNNQWGFLVFDGANNNILKNNSVGGNVRYDVELAGASNRFGYAAAATFNNTVRPGNQRNLVVKDCGNNNKINDRSQVIIVNNANDPCF